jgi:nucleoside-diphosphate-sugar epimerase
MRVVVVGATGNMGTSVLECLSAEPAVDEIIGVARRQPVRTYPRTRFVEADIASSDLVPIVRGADAVIHLAWLIQPGRDERVTRTVNVDGSERLFRAVAEAGVPALLYASSVGAYSPGPKDQFVDESWPTDGIASSFYARHKAEVERLLDRLQSDRPELRIVRMRPALVFKAQAATEIRRLFAGPLLPGSVLRSSLIPVVPDTARLRFQAVHSLDVGQAFCRAVSSDAVGAFNLAADPPIDAQVLAEIFKARVLRLPARVLRAGAALSYALRLQPSEPGWLDMALAVPLMNSGRARQELGWTPRHTAIDALTELLEGLRSGSDFDTPPLSRAASGPGRLREFMTGLGSRV